MAGRPPRGTAGGRAQGQGQGAPSQAHRRHLGAGLGPGGDSNNDPSVYTNGRRTVRVTKYRLELEFQFRRARSADVTVWKPEFSQ